jgi:hypothetical protein
MHNMHMTCHMHMSHATCHVHMHMHMCMHMCMFVSVSTCMRPTTPFHSQNEPIRASSYEYGTPL